MNASQFAALFAGKTTEPPSTPVLTLAALMVEFLKAHADNDTKVDTGYGLCATDFWLKFEGRELRVSITEKRNL